MYQYHFRVTTLLAGMLLSTSHSPPGIILYTVQKAPFYNGKVPARTTWYDITQYLSPEQLAGEGFPVPCYCLSQITAFCKR